MAKTRKTRQKAAIRHALDRQPGFASAQDLHDDLSKHGDVVALTTVYRALQRMVRDGEVDHLLKDDGEATYRLCSRGHHHHLVCRSCGRTVELASATVEAWAERESARHGFKHTGHTIEVYGTCARCAANRPARELPGP